MPSVTRSSRAALEAPKADRKSDVVAIPKSLAAAADLMFSIREKRLALQREVELLQKQETTLGNHLIDSLPKSDAQGVTGKLVNATIKMREVVELIGTEEDRFAGVYAYILKNAKRDPGVWSLLQRRVGEAAAKELIAAGKGDAIGARIGEVPFVSLTKPK